MQKLRRPANQRRSTARPCLSPRRQPGPSAREIGLWRTFAGLVRHRLIEGHFVRRHHHDGATFARNRIQNDPILNEGGTMVVLPSPGGVQETVCTAL